MKRCHYTGCQAGYIILAKALKVYIGYDVHGNLADMSKSIVEATCVFHLGCWAAYQLENNDLQV